MAEKKFLDTAGTRKVIEWTKAQFVQKDSSKGLSTNDFTGAYKEQLDNLATTYVTKTDVSRGLGEKVNAVPGKALSTNDYTTADRQKLSSIAQGANVNIIEIVQVNGSNLPVTNKAINVKVPTKVSDLSNDRDYATKSDINAAISSAGKLTKEIVDTLPAAQNAKDNVVYMVKNNTGVDGDIYSEYLLINGKMEKIGTTATKVDLSNYLTVNDVQVISVAEIEQMLEEV